LNAKPITRAVARGDPKQERFRADVINRRAANASRASSRSRVANALNNRELCVMRILQLNVASRIIHIRDLAIVRSRIGGNAR